MTPRLDLGDFLIPLIFIGVAIYQVIARARQKPEEPGAGDSPFPQDFEPEPGRDDRLEPETWDELMEALGQKPQAREETPPPLPPQPAPVVVPPPVVVASPPPLPRRVDVSPVWRNPSVSESVAPPEASSLSGGSVWKTAEGRSFWDQNPLARPESARSAFGQPAGLRREVPAFHSERLQRALTDPDRIREAILINEILQKPVALRPGPVGWSG